MEESLFCCYCSKNFYPEDDLEIGDTIDCPFCYEVLKITSVKPLTAEKFSQDSDYQDFAHTVDE